MTKPARTTATAPREASAWLRATAARRTRQVRAIGLNPDAARPIIVTWLTDPPDDAADRARWEWTCDRCDAHRPNELVLAQYRAARGLLLSLGLCPECADRESVR